MTARSDHVQWAKDRALRELERGDLAEAVTSMLSDMTKRDDTRPPDVLSMLGLQVIMRADPAEARSFIVGFN